MTQDGFMRLKASPIRAAWTWMAMSSLLDATIDKMLEKQEYSEDV